MISRIYCSFSLIQYIFDNLRRIMIYSNSVEYQLIHHFCIIYDNQARYEITNNHYSYKISSRISNLYLQLFNVTDKN